MFVCAFIIRFVGTPHVLYLVRISRDKTFTWFSSYRKVWLARQTFDRWCSKLVEQKPLSKTSYV